MAAKENRIGLAHLAAMLARANPKRPPYHVALDCNELVRFARTADSLALKQCNDPRWGDRDEKKRDRLNDKVQAVCQEYGIGYELGGDPRGCCLKLLVDDREFPVFF